MTARNVDRQAREVLTSAILPGPGAPLFLPAARPVRPLFPQPARPARLAGTDSHGPMDPPRETLTRSG